MDISVQGWTNRSNAIEKSLKNDRLMMV
jgi:hypothetical protein